MRGRICKKCCSRLSWNFTVGTQGKTFNLLKILMGYEVVLCLGNRVGSSRMNE